MARGDSRMRQAVRVGTRHLAYLEAGGGHDRTILLVHAFPLNASMWRPQLEAPRPISRIG